MMRVHSFLIFIFLAAPPAGCMNSDTVGGLKTN